MRHKVILYLNSGGAIGLVQESPGIVQIGGAIAFKEDMLRVSGRARLKWIQHGARIRTRIREDIDVVIERGLRMGLVESVVETRSFRRMLS